jgi:hypothetical protein
MDWLFKGLQNIFEASFEIIPTLGPTINNFLIVVVSALTVYWLLQMVKHYREGEKY